MLFFCWRQEINNEKLWSTVKEVFWCIIGNFDDAEAISWLFQVVAFVTCKLLSNCHPEIDHMHVQWIPDRQVLLLNLVVFCLACHGLCSSGLPHSCAVDQTLYINASSPEKLTFGLQAFKFIGNFSSVYMHCSAVVCHSTEPNSRCAQGCLNGSRKRRSAQTNTYAGTSQATIVSQGPFQLATKGMTGPITDTLVVVWSSLGAIHCKSHYPTRSWKDLGITVAPCINCQQLKVCARCKGIHSWLSVFMKAH